MSLGEEETRTPHTHTPSHLRRRAAPALKGKPRCPTRDPAGPDPLNAEVPGPDGAGVSGIALAVRRAYRALEPLFERVRGRRLVSLWSPHFSSHLGPEQLGRAGWRKGARVHLPRGEPHAEGDRCLWRQVVRLDSALLGRGDSGVTERPQAPVDGARPRAAGGAPGAWETRTRQVDFLRPGPASWRAERAPASRRASRESSTHQRQSARERDTDSEGETETERGTDGDREKTTVIKW